MFTFRGNICELEVPKCPRSPCHPPPTRSRVYRSSLWSYHISPRRLHCSFWSDESYQVISIFSLWKIISNTALENTSFAFLRTGLWKMVIRYGIWILRYHCGTRRLVFQKYGANGTGPDKSRTYEVKNIMGTTGIYNHGISPLKFTVAGMLHCTCALMYAFTFSLSECITTPIVNVHTQKWTLEKITKIKGYTKITQVFISL